MHDIDFPNLLCQRICEHLENWKQDGRREFGSRGFNASRGLPRDKTTLNCTMSPSLSFFFCKSYLYHSGFVLHKQYFKRPPQLQGNIVSLLLASFPSK